MHNNSILKIQNTPRQKTKNLSINSVCSSIEELNDDDGQPIIKMVKKAKEQKGKEKGKKVHKKILNIKYTWKINW